jgi:hypothetical protein
MADVTINGLAVLEARIFTGRMGNWTGDLLVDAQTAQLVTQGGAADIQAYGGNLKLSGTVIRGDAFAQLVTLRICGGKHGLTTICKPRFYRGVPLSAPLKDVLGDAGEQLSGTSTAAALSLASPFWTLIAQEASEALSMLVKAGPSGCIWRVLLDGTVFFGVDSYPDSSLTDFELLDYLPQEGLQVISSESPTVFPGETFNSKKVSAVIHLIAEVGARTQVLFDT